MTNLPIEKQVEEAFACTDNCHVDFPDLDCHWSSCAAYHRPAVLALLERREDRRMKLAKSWRVLAGDPKDWETPGDPTNTAITTAGRATMIKCAEELEAL